MSLPPTPNSMNFLPEDYVEKRQSTRAAMVFIGLLLVVVGGIVGAWLFTQWEDKSVFDENEKVNGQYVEASKKIADVQELDKEKARMVAKAEITTTLMERVRRSALLEELTRLRPKGVNFVEVDLKSAVKANPAKPLSDVEKAKRKMEGLPAEPDDDTPQIEVTVDLIGTAPTDFQVSQYIAGLNASPLLSDVNLLFSEEFQRGKDDSKEMVRRFHVEMKINPAADLRGAQADTPVSHLAASE